MTYSFIIPMYNEERDIIRTVERCLAQKTNGFRYEIILINDGSTDDTLKICTNRFSNEPAVRILNEVANRGVSHARNSGVSASVGDVVIFLNSDELVEPDFLLTLDRHYTHGAADYVFPQTRVANIDTVYGLYRDCYRLAKYHRPNLFMWSQGFSCRKELFFAVGGFSESYPGCGGEDWDFVSRLDKLQKNRVVDLVLVVRHTVPCGIKNVLWHMYNRGRGTAYYDLIYCRKSPAFYCVKLLLCILCVFLSFLWDKNVTYVIIIYKVLSLFSNGLRISSISSERRWQVALMNMIDTVVRFWGYTVNIISRKRLGTK